MTETTVHTSELRLVERAAGGDRDAKRDLFERYRDVAYRVAFRVTGRHEDAMDVVQDGFIKAFGNLGGFQRTSSFKTWLLRIVNNKALDLLRSRKVRLAAPLDAGDDLPQAEYIGPARGDKPADAMTRRELGERLHQAIDSLPPEQRTVFALYAAGEMTYGEIAEVVGVPLGTVMSRIYHARRKLHEMLPDLAPRETERSKA